METRLIRTVVLFLVLTLVFGVLERYWPSIANQPKLRRGLGVDILYWFVTPLVSQVLTIVAVAMALFPVYVLLGRSLQLDQVLAGYGPAGALPLWVQGLIVIFVGDFIGYWTHRLNHRSRYLWDYHAVHHSAETIDWLTAVRIHPFNDVFSKGIQAIPILLLGFSPVAVEPYMIFLTSYIALIHANVPWTYGPFRYLIASPAYHRWHHTTDEKFWGKNYAGLFPIFDIIFGTYHLPDEQPRDFGLCGETIPENFMGQMLYPFRTWKLSRLKLTGGLRGGES